MALYLYALLLLFVLECSSRLFLKIRFDRFFPTQEILWQSYYPVLKNIRNFSLNSSEKKLLILGGSVVYADTVLYTVRGRNQKVTFCSFKNFYQNDLQIINLAYPAHTSLDSRYKLEILSNLSFDYVLIYHGINDVRANHIDKHFFDPLYRHIAFYDELYVVNRHPEIRYFAAPFALHFLWAKARVWLGLNRYIPEFKYDPGCNEFTSNTFRNNIEHCINQIIAKSATPILLTYASYQPNDYSKERFLNGELDYSSDLFPTELYGSADCVPRLIGMHNDILRSIAAANQEKVLFHDFAKDLPKSGSYFMDICHLTNVGCERMYQVVDSLISHNLKSSKPR